MDGEKVDNEKSCPATSMKEWVGGAQKEGECRPCLMAPVTQWYRDELQERGRADLAEKIEKAVDAGEDVASLLDAIKAEVGEEVANRLRDFDCSAQSYSEEKGGDSDEAQPSGNRGEGSPSAGGDERAQA